MNTTIGAVRPSPVHEIPGRALGVWSFVLSFIVPVLGLIFGILALRQSGRAGVSNTLAVAGVVISTVLLVVGVTLWIVFVGAGAGA